MDRQTTAKQRSDRFLKAAVVLQTMTPVLPGGYRRHAADLVPRRAAP